MSSNGVIRKGLIPVVGPQNYMTGPNNMGYYSGAFSGNGDLGFIGLRRRRWMHRLKSGELTREEAQRWLPKIERRMERLERRLQREHMSDRRREHAKKRLAEVKAVHAKVKSIVHPNKAGEKEGSAELSGILDYWTGYTDWWSQQNAVVKVAAPAAFLFAVYQIPAVKKQVKKMMNKGS